MEESSKQTKGASQTQKKAFGGPRQYSKLKSRLMIFQLFLTVAFLVIMLFSGGTLLLKELVMGLSGNFYLQVGFYLTILAGIYYLLFVGLDFYSDFLLEHRFQLSNQTALDWLKRSVKKAALSLLLLLMATEGLYFFLKHFPNYWWLLTAMAWVLLSVVLSKITPILIIPLFYKCKPLANGSLKERLLQLSKNCAVAIEQVLEIGLSKETRKANAAVAGLGKNRRILLGDTLLKNFSEDEIEAIFAHELGHIRMHHTWKILGFGTAIAFISFFLTHLILEKGMTILGFDGIADIAGFPFLAVILMIITLVFMPIQNGYMRYLERQADIFAIRCIENGQSFISAITKLSQQNLSDPSPGRWEELLLYDHPPISKRLRYLRQEDEKKYQ